MSLFFTITFVQNMFRTHNLLPKYTRYTRPNARYLMRDVSYFCLISTKAGVHQQILLHVFKNSRKFVSEVLELFHMQRPICVTLRSVANAQLNERQAIKNKFTACQWDSGVNSKSFECLGSQPPTSLHPSCRGACDQPANHRVSHVVPSSDNA